MRSLFAQILRDDRGFVVSAELVLIATIVVLGSIVGLAAYRDAVVQELTDTGAAVGALNQSFSEHYSGPGIGQDRDGTVTIKRTYGNSRSQYVTVTATFKASSYTDTADRGGADTQSRDGSATGIIIVPSKPESAGLGDG